MDTAKIVENIQNFCDKNGITPTVAGRESGAGKDLVSAMKQRGVLPSIEKMSLLANYLGVTVSELLGEPLPESSASTPQEQEFARLFAQLRPEQQELVIAQLHGILDANDRNASSSE
ncbi:hypothetical protein ACTQ33_10575 [Candidatus Avoscillospira sp. LCP25S3_F1]|uniref:hypothetical protein n=1 Tax=Candidatus Avoscillospira sp. LCP25S3_F1 TaxID=3438825 RepID=UPI003F92106F